MMYHVTISPCFISTLTHMYGSTSRLFILEHSCVATETAGTHTHTNTHTLRHDQTSQDNTWKHDRSVSTEAGNIERKKKLKNKKT